MEVQVKNSPCLRLNYTEMVVYKLETIYTSEAWRIILYINFCIRRDHHRNGFYCVAFLSQINSVYALVVIKRKNFNNTVWL